MCIKRGDWTAHELLLAEEKMHGMEKEAGKAQHRIEKLGTRAATGRQEEKEQRWQWKLGDRREDTTQHLLLARHARDSTTVISATTQHCQICTYTNGAAMQLLTSKVEKVAFIQSPVRCLQPAADIRAHAIKLDWFWFWLRWSFDQFRACTLTLCVVRAATYM